MEYYPIIKGQFNSYYDYDKIFKLQRLSVEGKIKAPSHETIKTKKVEKKSLGPSLILRNSPRTTNRGK